MTAGVPAAASSPVLDVDVEHLARLVRAEHVAREPLVLEGDLRLGRREPRLRARDLLRARAVPERREPLLHGDARRVRVIVVGLAPVELRLRDGCVVEEALGAFEVLLRQVLGRERRPQVGRGRSDVLAARACLEQREIRARGIRLGAPRVAHRDLERIIELRERVTRVHEVSAMHANLRDTPGNLERDEALVVLDDPLIPRRKSRPRAARHQPK